MVLSDSQKHVIDGRELITGSKIAAIMGLNPWQTPLDVWLTMTGRAELFNDDNLRLKVGRLLELPVLRIYEDESGNKAVHNTALIKHKEAQWAACTPDGFYIMPNNSAGSSKPDGGIDAKTVSPWAAKDWAEDKLPIYVVLQMQWCMFVTGLSEWHVPALIGFDRYICPTVYRDDELIDRISEAAHDWYQKHVVEDEQPEPDASKKYGQYIAEQYKEHTDIILDASSEIDALAANIKQWTANKKAIEQALTEAENKIKAYVADAKGVQGSIDGEPYKITWSRGDSNKTSWKAVAQGAGASQELIDANTTTSTSSRINKSGAVR